MQERNPQSRPPPIYKPYQQIESLALSLGRIRGHRTQNGEPPDASNPASGALKLATCQPFESHMSISNGYLQTTGRSQVCTELVRYSLNLYVERVLGHRTLTTKRSLVRPMLSTEMFESLLTDTNNHWTLEQQTPYVRR